MLFLRAIFGLLAYDILSTVCRFEIILSTVKGWKTAAVPANAEAIQHVCKAVNYACIWYPKQVLCLQRSFVTTYLLRQFGIQGRMVLGAQKLPFKAHAWVEVEGRPVNDKSNVHTTYAVWDQC